MAFLLVYDSSRFKAVKCLNIYLCRVVWLSFFSPVSFVFPLESLCNYILQSTSNSGQDGSRKEDNPEIEMHVCVGAAKSRERDAVFRGGEDNILLCLISVQVVKVPHF